MCKRRTLTASSVPAPTRSAMTYLLNDHSAIVRTMRTPEVNVEN